MSTSSLITSIRVATNKDFHTIYNIYSNESPFKNYISISELGGGLRPFFGPEFRKTCFYSTCMLPDG